MNPDGYKFSWDTANNVCTEFYKNRFYLQTNKFL